MKLLPVRPKNKIELKRAVQEIWDSIEIATINSLIESFYYQFYLVAIHNGESIQSYYRHYHNEDYEHKAQEFCKELKKFCK